MNIEEVCKAFIEKKELVSNNENRYKMDKGTLWVLSDSMYPKWEEIVTDYPFTYPLKMRLYEEYNLTFFEAMRKADEGCVVSNDGWGKIEYVMHDGIPCYFGNGEIASFTKSDLQAKWKVVRKVEE